MMRKIIVIFCLLGVSDCVRALPSTFVKACETVSIKLLENNSKNIIVCPLGIMQTLAPFAVAAKKSIRKQIIRYFDIAAIKNDEIYQLAHWLEKQPFSSKTYCFPSYDLPQLPFALFNAFGMRISFTDYKIPAEAVASINSFVRKDLSGNISDFIQSSQLRPTTLMILLNTFSLQKTWIGTFDKSKMTFAEKKDIAAIKSYSGQYLFHKKDVLAKFELKDRIWFIIKMSPFGPRPVTASDMALFKSSGQHLLEEGEYQCVVFPSFKAKLTLDLRSLLAKSLPDLLTKPFKLNFLESLVGIDFYQQSNDFEVNDKGISAFSATAASVGLRSVFPANAKKEILFNRPFSWVLVKESDGQNLMLMAGYLFVPN